MKWLTDSDVDAFIQLRNYDVRVSGNARWIDQKCTADVLTIVSDCITVHVDKFPLQEFTTKDIWHSDYTIENVQAIFKKPQVTSEKARNEYDKFFQQPMELLSYAGILKKRKVGGRNFYLVAEPDLLVYLSIRERSSLTFLQKYICKVLADSGIMGDFDEFFTKQTKPAYDKLKSKFEQFTKQFRIFDLPFMFKNIHAVDEFQSSATGQAMKESMTKRGLLGLAFWHNGMKQMSANVPLMLPSDADGLKFRVQNSEVLKAQMAAMGASPQPMAFSEVYGALQTRSEERRVGKEC